MDRQTEFQEMIRLAKQNIELAIHDYQTKHTTPYEMICYNSQQSAEKFLKAFLIKHNTSYRRTHDLILLTEVCEEIDGSFEDLYDECERLNLYVVVPKYPHELPMNEMIVEKAIKAAQEIEKFILEKLGLTDLIYQEAVVDFETKKAIFDMMDLKVPLDTIRKVSNLSSNQFKQVLFEYDDQE